MRVLLKIGFCLGLMAFYLFSYLDLQNQVTELKIAIPDQEKKIRLVLEENKRLSYEIEQFENPSHLMEIAHRPEYSHLKHPIVQEIQTVSEALAVSKVP